MYSCIHLLSCQKACSIYLQTEVPVDPTPGNQQRRVEGRMQAGWGLGGKPSSPSKRHPKCTLPRPRASDQVAAYGRRFWVLQHRAVCQSTLSLDLRVVSHQAGGHTRLVFMSRDASVKETTAHEMSLQACEPVVVQKASPGFIRGCVAGRALVLHEQEPPGWSLTSGSFQLGEVYHPTS